MRRCVPPVNKNARSGGFTLVEMMVALTLFSIISISIYSVFRSGLNTWRAGNQWSEENQTARTFFRMISQELSNSVDYAPDYLFEGSDHSISFMTLLDTHKPGLDFFKELKRIRYDYDSQKKTLSRRVAGKEEGFDSHQAREVMTADGVSFLEFSYAFKAVYDYEGYRWKKEWKDIKKTPRGVHILWNDWRTTVFIPLGFLGDENA